MNYPIFSIIVASYNNGEYLAECLESLINQTYKNIEIVVVDDCSKDNSVEIIKQYQQKDNRIKLFVNEKNKGVGYTKKRGVENSNGEICGTIGADDTLDLQTFEIMINAHIENPKASLIYSTHYICNQKLEIIKINNAVKSIPKGETYLTYKDATSSTISSFRTFKRKNYLNTSGFDSYFKKAVDKDIIFKLEEVGETIFIDKPLYFYRHHTRNISMNNQGLKAFLWEVRAKEKAYYRRLNTDIPNISKQQLLNDYYFAFKNLAFQAVENKQKKELLNIFINFAKVFKNPMKIAKFIYYILRGHKLIKNR